MKKKFQELNDYQLDKALKIQGTPWDRKRKLTDDQVAFCKLAVSSGVTCSSLAQAFGVWPNTIRYNVDSEFRNKQRNACSGKHTGSPSDLHERVQYKRALLQNGFK